MHADPSTEAALQFTRCGIGQVAYTCSGVDEWRCAGARGLVSGFQRLPCEMLGMGSEGTFASPVAIPAVSRTHGPASRVR